MDEHQSGCFIPVRLFVGFTVGLSHGSVPSLHWDRAAVQSDVKARERPILNVTLPPLQTPGPRFFWRRFRV
jgi:hypothetical protein